MYYIHVDGWLIRILFSYNSLVTFVYVKLGKWVQELD